MNDNMQWQFKRLTDLAQYINGYAFKPTDWSKDGLPIIRIEQLKNPDSIDDFYSGKLSEQYIIRNGDLIFSWSASLFLKIWKNGDSALNQHLFKVIEKNGVDRIFLKQFIEFYLPELTKASHGSTMQHITRKELDRFGAQFPVQKSEQSKIAEILTIVDKSIEQTESLIGKQQRIKTGLMQDILTRGIDEKGNIRSEETHRFKDSSLGRIPVEWESGTLSSYARLKGGFAFSSKHSREDGIRWLKIANVGAKGIIWGTVDFLPIEYADMFVDYLLKENDIVVALTRPVIRGELKISKLNRMDVPCLLNQRVAKVIPNKNTDNEFLLALMKSRYYVDLVEKAILGTDPPNISTNKMEDIIVPVIGIDEQARIGIFLEKQRILSEQYIKQHIKAMQLKTALMQDLLTGKVRVTKLLDETEISA